MRAPLVIPALLVALALAAPVACWAGRPLDTEDTGTLDPGAVEVELGGDFARGAGTTVGGGKLTVSLGLLPGLEGRFETTVVVLDPRDAETESGPGDSLLGFKYRLLDEGDATPAILAGIALRLPTGDEDRGLGAKGVDVGVAALVGKTLGLFAVNGNAGYRFATADRRLDAWVLAASVEYLGGPAWTLVAETVHNILPRGPDTAIIRGGGTWTVHPLVRFDAAVGAGLTRHSPDVTVTIGVTLGAFSTWGP